MSIFTEIAYKLPDDLVDSFRESTDRKNLGIIRLAVLAGAILYSVFGYLDKALVPELTGTFWFIRYAVVVPISILIIAATYVEKLFKWIQPLLSISVIVAGLGINYMILVAPTQVGNNYYAGLILIFIFSYSFLRISFKWATFSGWFIVLAYEFSAIYVLDTSADVLINNNFFFISANIIGMFSNLTYEYKIRKEFHTAYLLDLSNKEIIENNTLLEERVWERTQKLEDLNRQLLNEIEERNKVEANLIKAKESAVKANKLKSEFLAQMSHEIRSPINTIINFTSLIEDLLEEVKDIEMQQCFAGIDSASRRVVRTIDLILNTSELQLGTYEPSYREVDLSDILNNLHKEYFKLAASKKLAFNLNIAQCNSTIFTDDYAVNQIFANLIDNAIKYTSEGYIEIALINGASGSLNVTVKDTGKGISEEYLPQIFEQFTQEEEGYSRKFEGNGLGLALVKNYCNLIGAQITVESKKEIGSTFRIKF